MLIKERRSEVKVYGCLFVRMATTACHLELVNDLSTDHFIVALKRFIARRGRPQRIYSDNGTSFVGANNELRKCLEQLDEEKMCTVPSTVYWVASKKVLRTALVEAEGILNSRPITHVSSDVGDIEALTPNHFLLLRANPSYEEADVSEREIDSTELWRQFQALVIFFWKHFTMEFLIDSFFGC